MCSYVPFVQRSVHFFLFLFLCYPYFGIFFPHGDFYFFSIFLVYAMSNVPNVTFILERVIFVFNFPYIFCFVLFLSLLYLAEMFCRQHFMKRSAISWPTRTLRGWHSCSMHSKTSTACIWWWSSTLVEISCLCWIGSRASWRRTWQGVFKFHNTFIISLQK